MNIFYAVAWLVQMFFWLGLLPQLFLNFKMRSTKGMSDMMLFGYLNGYLFNSYYVYCYGLPLAYRVMLPLALVTVLIMVAQRFWYDRDTDNTFLLRSVLASLVIAIVLLPFARVYPMLVGNVAGWIMMIIWATYQIPQVVKISESQSVVGFSLLLVMLIGFGDSLEFLTGIMLGFPIQSLLNSTRGILIFSIFSFQFWHYSQKEIQESNA